MNKYDEPPAYYNQPGGPAQPQPSYQGYGGGYQQGPPPNGYYGQQPMMYGPGPGPYQQQPGPYGPYYQQQPYGYYDNRPGAGPGMCEAFLAAMACCCCLDCLLF